MPATNRIQTSRGYRRRIFPAFVWAASLVAAAETESRPSGTAVPPSNFDSGLNRLREKKSGPAGEPGKNEAADAVKAAKAAEPAVVVAPSTATAKPVTIPEGNQSRAVASTAGVAPPAGPVTGSGPGMHPRGWQLGLAGILLSLGLWAVWTQEIYRMDAEEMIKDNKISPDRAASRFANRKLGGNLSIIGGLLLFLYALL